VTSDDRLLACVEGGRELKPPALLDRIFETVGRFTGGAAQNDDMTALVLRYAGP